MRNNNCRHSEGRHHDCEYVDARNKLIESAETRTHREVGIRWELDTTEDHDAWDAAFLRNMDTLYKELSREQPKELPC